MRKVALLLALTLLLASCGKSEPKPPRFGVVSFGLYSVGDALTVLRVDKATLDSWREDDRRLAELHFRSEDPGEYSIIGFVLKTPDGEDLLPRYFKYGNDRWEVAFSPEDKILNPVLINVLMGELELRLIYLIKGEPSTEFVLTHSSSDTQGTFKVEKGALGTY